MRKYQGVTAFVGFPGSGKTYSLAAIGAKAIAKGETVYCNRGFDLEGAVVLQSFEQFSDVEHGIMLWDELPLYFNARKWAEFPDSMLYKFTQIRKDGVKLFYSAIHENMIDTNIRRVTFWSWHCRAITSRYFVRALLPGPEMRRPDDRARHRELVRVRMEVASLYDTTRKVELPKKLRERLEREQAEREAPRLGAQDPGEPGGAPEGVPGRPDGVLPAYLMAPIASPLSEYSGRHTGESR